MRQHKIPSSVRRIEYVALSVLAVGLYAPSAFAQATDADDFGANLIILSLIMLVGYMIPTLVAFVRGHPNRWLIAVINIVLGGTGLGWLGSFVWAFSAVHRSPKGNHGGESGLNLFVNDAQMVRIETAAMSGSVDAISAKLIRLKTLRESGAITEDEYAEMARPILATIHH